MKRMKDQECGGSRRYDNKGSKYQIYYPNIQWLFHFPILLNENFNSAGLQGSTGAPARARERHFRAPRPRRNADRIQTSAGAGVDVISRDRRNIMIRETALF